jgi:hypothetical protein
MERLPSPEPFLWPLGEQNQLRLKFSGADKLGCDRNNVRNVLCTAPSESEAGHYARIF